MRILYIGPDSIGVFDDYMQRLINGVVSRGSVVKVVSLDYEPKVANLPQSPIYQEALFSVIRQAEADGYDAAIIGCCADPGLKDAVTIGKMPVFGAMQLGIHAATLRGRQVCVLGPVKIDGRRGRPLSWHKDNIYSYCFRPEAVTFRKVRLDRPSAETVGAMFLDGRGDEVRRLVLDAHRESILGEALAQTRLAVAQDNAEVIFLGCTLWGGMAAELEELSGVPVIDPVYASIWLAEAMVKTRKGVKSRYGSEIQG